MIKLCTPALIYFIFSVTQILIDLFKGMYNTASMKVIVTIMVTMLLNILCDRGLGLISWIIVFVPFILMTVIVTMLLYVFGLDPATGTLNINNTTKPTNVTTDSQGNIIVYDPYYDAYNKPVYYKTPNIIVPKPPTNPTNPSNPMPMPPHPMPPGRGSSDPAYQS